MMTLELQTAEKNVIKLAEKLQSSGKSSMFPCNIFSFSCTPIAGFMSFGGNSTADSSR